MISTNDYFGGSVKSLGYQTPAGKSTVGVIDSGEYEFGTSQHEIMIIVEGELSVLLPGSDEWQLYSQGERFEVPAGTSFEVKASRPVAYLCQYR
ncbi:pyrimidine/purine nucleoside phosphorylase [Telluribacter sp.]|uniref:pyrimidine/purine nucleoside phosphorylase n=1 Tax=Telluribacter sp. TaxID=1978767 RepID=UPI002E15500C|nr:pyrimidine/purine nucleoside phosphorylase [Telluribacter sp.]